MGSDLQAPGVEHVGEGLLDRESGLPAGRGAELGGVGDEQGLIDGADPGGVDEDLDRPAGERGEDVQGVGELRAAAGAEVVNLAGGPFFDQEAVAPDDVADVGEVADDVEVADLDAGLPARLDLGHLSGQGAQDVGGRLPGAGVVERPGHHDVGPVRQEVLDPEQVGGGLAGGIGVVRAQRATSETGMCSGAGLP